jgi:hypothetical protein
LAEFALAAAVMAVMVATVVASWAAVAEWAAVAAAVEWAVEPLSALIDLI